MNQINSGAAVAEPKSGDVENWDDVDSGNVTPVEAKASSRRSKAAKPQSQQPPKQDRKRPLYFDIETVPDEERMESFGLEPLPRPLAESEAKECPKFAEFLDGTIDNVKGRLKGLNPVEGYLEPLERCERLAKNRKGVLEAIDACRAAKTAHLDAHAERMKLLSTTPEFCKIVAIGLGDYHGVDAHVVRSKAVKAADVERERTLLQMFWSAAQRASTIIGFNVLYFDLPVIFVRSILLGVPASRMIDTSPYGRDVIDLYLKRFGPRGNTDKKRPGKLKRLAELYGIDVPAGDVDGGDVLELWKTDPDKLAKYVESDVVVTRELHYRMSGFFV